MQGRRHRRGCWTRSLTIRPGGESVAAAKPRFYVFDKTTKKPFPGEPVDRLRLRRGRAGLAQRGAAEERAGHRDPGRRAPAARAEGRARRSGPRPLVGHPGPSGPLGHGHQGPGAELRHDDRQRTDRHVQLHGQGSSGVPDDHASRRRARRRQRVRWRPAPDLAALRDRPRQRARLGAVHQLASELRGHRRLHRRADLRLVHDPVRSGPRDDPEDRCPAADAQRGVAFAGLRDARPAGARSGPDRRYRGLHHRRALPDHLLPRAGCHRDDRDDHLRDLLLRGRQAHPDHADAAGHRGSHPDPRRGRGREHRRSSNA